MLKIIKNQAGGNRKTLKWLKTLTKSNFINLKLKSHEEYLIYLRTIFYYAKDSFRFGPKCTDIRYARVQSRDTRTRNMYFVVSGMLYPVSTRSRSSPPNYPSVLHVQYYFKVLMNLKNTMNNSMPFNVGELKTC